MNTVNSKRSICVLPAVALLICGCVGNSARTQKATAESTILFASLANAKVATLEVRVSDKASYADIELEFTGTPAEFQSYLVSRGCVLEQGAYSCVGINAAGADIRINEAQRRVQVSLTSVDMRSGVPGNLNLSTFVAGLSVAGISMGEIFTGVVFAGGGSRLNAKTVSQFRGARAVGTQPDNYRIPVGRASILLSRLEVIDADWIAPQGNNLVVSLPLETRP